MENIYGKLRHEDVSILKSVRVSFLIIFKELTAKEKLEIIKVQGFDSLPR